MRAKPAHPALPAFDPALDPDPVPSPCVNLCRMNPHTGWCEGCWRTIDEIVAWGGATEVLKRGVWAAIRRRAAAIDEAEATGGTPRTPDVSADRAGS